MIPSQKMVENNQESNFFGSLILLLMTTSLSIAVLLIYDPDEDTSSQYIAAKRNKSQVAAVKTQKNKRRFHSNYQVKDREYRKKEPQISYTQMSPNPRQKTSVDIDALMNEAMNLVDNNDANAAIKILEKILREDPHNELALRELGMIYLIDLKDSSKALTYLERSYALNPNNKIVLSELVGLYEELGQASAGLTFLQDLYDQNPSQANLALGIGQMFVSQDRLIDAIPYLEKAVEQESSELSLAELGDAYSEVGQMDKALQTYRRRVEWEEEASHSGRYDEHPGLAQERIALARIDVLSLLVERGQYDLAEEEYEKIKEQIKDEQILRPLFQQIQVKRLQSRSRATF